MNISAKISQQNGFAILEALIAFIVLGVGLLVLLNFNNSAIQNAGDSKARLEATALAQNKIQELRSFLDNDTAAGSWWATNMTSLAQASAESITGANASFSRWWTVVDNDRLVSIVVNVAWQDRNGESQIYTLTSDLYDVDPLTAASVLNTSIQAFYDPDNPNGEERDKPLFDDLDNDRRREVGDWSVYDEATDTTYDFNRRIKISGEIDKANQDITLPTAQVFPANNSYVVCDFGNSAGYPGPSKPISLTSGQKVDIDLADISVIKVLDANAPDGPLQEAQVLDAGGAVVGVKFSYTDGNGNSVTVMTVKSDGSISIAPLTPIGNKYTISYQVLNNSGAVVKAGQSTTVEVELYDGSFLCYGYYQAANIEYDVDGNIVSETGGFSGTLHFSVSTGAIFCFPIVDPNALGKTEFDKVYENVTENQTLFLQVATNVGVCPSQL